MRQLPDGEERRHYSNYIPTKLKLPGRNWKKEDPAVFGQIRSTFNSDAEEIVVPLTLNIPGQQ